MRLILFMAALASSTALAEPVRARYLVELPAAESFEEAVRVPNCLAYTTCLRQVPLLGIEKQKITFSVLLDAERAEIESALSACDLSGLEGRIVFREWKKNGATLAVPKKAFEPKKNSDPVPSFIRLRGVGTKFADSVRALIDSALAASTSEQAAAEAFRDGVGIPDSGFPLRLVEPNDPRLEGVGASTFSLPGFEGVYLDRTRIRDDFCAFAWELKHEYEHAYQVKRARACGAKSVFSQNRFRELFAYMNTGVVARAFCPDRARRTETWSIRTIVEEDYLARAGIDYVD